MLCYPRKMLVSPADLGAKSEDWNKGQGRDESKKSVNDRLVEPCKTC